MKITLKNIVIEIDDEWIERGKKCGLDEDEIRKRFAYALWHPLRKTIMKHEKKYCQVCGKMRQSQMTHYQVVSVNKGWKSIKELGYCTCDD